jgi:hypothetical protein
MYDERTRVSQNEYNLRHNNTNGLSGQTPYETLIEQVVTGDRGFMHLVFHDPKETEQDPIVLKQALEWMHYRDEDGYRPELPRLGVTRKDYVIQGDDVFAPAYAKALRALTDYKPLDRKVGWEHMAINDALVGIVSEGNDRTEEATGNWSDIPRYEDDQ